MKGYLITALILAVTAIAGFTMPKALLQWQDAKRLETSEIQETEEVVLTSQTEMTLIEKIQMMQADMVTTIEMTEGKSYSIGGMIVNAQQQLKELSELGIIELERLDLTFGVDNIMFWIDIQGGTRSMLLWSVHAESKEGIYQMLIDDETGKILTVNYNAETTMAVDGGELKEELKKEAVKFKDLELTAEKWAEYLDVQLVETSSYDMKYYTETAATFEDGNGKAEYVFQKDSDGIFFVVDTF